jgi:hypothetical protein
MALFFATLLVVANPIQGGTEWPTLRQELQKHRVDASRLEDAGRQITSYAVASTDEWFGIAYYWYAGSDLLPKELRVRTLERKTGAWRHAVLNTEELKGGSAVGIARRRG